ncbi:MAG: Hsp70 family protein, partial [Stackebrandtia sp.]
VTRTELDAVARPLLDRTVRIMQGVIRESRLAPHELAGIFLAGAASRMPLVATLLHREIGLAPVTVEQPELAVSEGGLTAPSSMSPPNPSTPVQPIQAGSPPISPATGFPVPPPAPPFPAIPPAPVTPAQMGSPPQPQAPGSAPPTPVTTVPEPSPATRSRRRVIAAVVGGLAIVVALAILVVVVIKPGSGDDALNDVVDDITVCPGTFTAPWVEETDDGDFVGLDAALMDMLAKRLGEDVTWVDPDSEYAINSTQVFSAGTCDIVSGMSDRLGDAKMSTVYFRDFPVLVTLDDKPRTFESLKGDGQVGVDVGESDISDNYVLSVEYQYAFSMKSYDSQPELAQALESGEIDGAFMYMDDWVTMPGANETLQLADAEREGNTSFE